MDKNFSSACDNFTGPEHPDPGSPKVRSQVLFWNICVLHIKVEQKWRNIHQCDKRNRQNGNDTLVICYPCHLKPLTEMWWKNLPSLLRISTLFRKHQERSPLNFYSYPVISLCICRCPATQTMWLYNTYRNFANTSLWKHEAHQNNLGWNTGQLKITAPESQERRDAPYPPLHPRSNRHMRCNPLLAQSCGYRRNYSSSLIWSPKNLGLRLFIDLVTKYLWKMISWTVLRSQCTRHTYFKNTLLEAQGKWKWP